MIYSNVTLRMLKEPLGVWHFPYLRALSAEVDVHEYFIKNVDKMRGM